MMYRVAARPVPCLGRLAAFWSLYGIALAMLWQAAGPHEPLRAAVWLGGLALGIALAVREI